MPAVVRNPPGTTRSRIVPEVAYCAAASTCSATRCHPERVLPRSALTRPSYRTSGERLHRDVRVELRPLGRRPVPAGHAPARPAGALRAPVRHRRAQRELLPLAAHGDFRELATPSSAGIRAVGEGAAR